MGAAGPGDTAPWRRAQPSLPLARLRETCYWFIVKGCNSATARKERCTGPGVWNRTRSFHAFSTPSSRIHVFTNPEALKKKTNKLSWVFTAAHYSHDWLNHWPLSQPPSGLMVQEWDSVSQPSNHLVGWPGNQPPPLGGVPKPPH